MESNFTKQAEEIQALCSIYGADWASEGSVSYSMRIDANHREALLLVTLPPGYPGQTPPQYELSAPWMDRKAKAGLHNALDGVYLENIGECIIFQWVEKIREILQAVKPERRKKNDKVACCDDKAITKINIQCPEITHGPVIVDRKSSFQGHAAEVHSIEDVRAVLNKLKLERKIQHAKHNIYAYRIERKNGKCLTICEDYDDDGERQAGGRVLHLLSVLHQRNTLVVVSRWYGGIHLGPDRFRHINNVARQAIEQAGLLRK